MLFFVPPERRQALRDTAEEATVRSVRFLKQGSHVVVYEPEAAYDKSLATERGAIYAPEALVAKQAVEAESLPNGLLATAFQR